MDIWQWVGNARDDLHQQGEERLAELLYELPTLVVDEEHEKVDAIIPEALAIAKKQPNKWLEVFIRHWHLQSLVLNRHQVTGVLPEAVDLLQFAHQEDTRDCPQSICVVQDLANCYACQDNLGFTEQRIAVANEHLAKIDGSWDCYECIGSELVSAINDTGNWQQALDTISDLRQEILLKSGRTAPTAFCFDEVEAHIQLGQLEQAETVMLNTTHDIGGDHFIHRKNNVLCYLYAQMDKFDLALQRRLSFDTAIKTPSLTDDWCRSAYELARKEAINNDWRLNHQFSQLCDKLLAQGCYRSALHNSERQAELCLQRDQRASFITAIERIESILPKLAKDCGAQQSLDDLKLRGQHLSPITKLDFTDIDTLFIHLDEDLEQRSQQLIQALSKWPGNERLAQEYADNLAMLEQTSQRKSFLREFLQQHPNSEEIISLYGFGYNDPEFMQNLLQTTISDNNRCQIYWLLTHQYLQQQQTKQATHWLDKLLEHEPDARNALQKAAHLKRQTGEIEAALAHLQHLLQLFPEDKSAHWDRLVVASLLENHPLIRQSAEFLQLPVKSNLDPIDETWEMVRIQHTLADGEHIHLLARRTGPVTARIQRTYDLQEPCYFHDEVIFDPSPLNRLDQQDDEGYWHDEEGYYTYLYPHLKTTKAGGYTSFDLECVFPGETLWNHFVDALQQQGISITQRSNEHYTLSFRGEDVKAIYCYFYVETQQSLEQLNQRLHQLTEDFPHPMIWAKLTARLGKDEELQRLQQIVDTYQIEL